MVRTTSWRRVVTYCPGPKRLSFLFFLGVTLTFLGLLLAVWSAWRQGLWKIDEPPAGQHWPICHCQLQNRHSKFEENKQQLQDLCSRQCYLEKIQSDPSNVLNYSTAPGLMIELKKSVDELEIKQKALRGDSVQDSLPRLIILLLFTTVFSFVAGRLMVWHGNHIGLVSATGEDLAGWKRPYWILVLAFFVLQELREIKTSVLAVDKPWFGWNSFCLSTSAWSMSQIMAFGAFLAIGYPACIIWCLSRSQYRPTKLEMDAPDGAWGVGDYVLFVQTWSLLVFIFLLVPTLIWIRLSVRYLLPAIYLLPTLGLFIGAGIVASRLVWQGIQIRLMYLREMQSLGSWSKIRTVSPPPDPTSGFLGDRWWNLPATIIATISAFWIVIEWSGLGEWLGKLIGVG